MPGLGYAAVVCALTEAVAIAAAKSMLPFGNTAIGALAGGVAGNELQSAFRDLYSNVARTLRNGNPAVNHHLQKALSRAFALAALHVVTRFGERCGAGLRGADLVLAGPAAGVVNRLAAIFPSLHANEQGVFGEADRVYVQTVAPKLIARAKDPAAESEPGSALESAYRGLEELLDRAASPASALRDQLTADAIRVVTDFGYPHALPPVLQAELQSDFAGAFFAAFREVLTQDGEARAVFDGILTSEIKRDTGQILPIVTRTLELVQAAQPAVRVPLEPASRTTSCYGRDEQIERLAQLLLHPTEPVLVCSVHGLPGVGKSFLVDTLAWRRRADFPGYYKLPMEAGTESRGMMNTLADRLGVRGDEAQVRAQVRAALIEGRALVHIENVDSDAAAVEARKLTGALNGCRVVLTGRIRDLGRGFGWAPLPLDVLSAAAAMAMLEAEFRPAGGVAEKARYAVLLERLGFLPLAIHLAAGQLRSRAYTVDDLIAEAAILDLEPESGEGDGARRRLRSSFRLSVDLLAAQRGGSARAVIAAFGTAPLCGVGAGLGAAICGLDERTFRLPMADAGKLSLVSAEEKNGRTVWKTHPLLALFFRDSAPEADREAPFARMSAWFRERVRQRKDDPAAQGRAWGEVDAEREALESWLGEVPAEIAAKVAQPAQEFARTMGPYRAWAALCERGLAAGPEDAHRSDLLWFRSNVLIRAGDLEGAGRAAREQAELDGRRGADRDRALALGQIADILEARGQLDEALRIRREDELPVYEKLGDIRSRAVTMGKIAD